MTRDPDIWRHRGHRFEVLRGHCGHGVHLGCSACYISTAASHQGQARQFRGGQSLSDMSKRLKRHALKKDATAKRQRRCPTWQRIKHHIQITVVHQQKPNMAFTWIISWSSLLHHQVCPSPRGMTWHVDIYHFSTHNFQVSNPLLPCACLNSLHWLHNYISMVGKSGRAKAQLDDK